MLRRLIFENWAILCTLIAFATALSIFLFIAYRALRMSRKDASRIASIPLEKEKRVLAGSEGEAAAKGASGQAGTHAGVPGAGGDADSITQPEADSAKRTGK